MAHQSPTAERKIQAAIAQIVQDHPFWAGILLKHQITADPKCSTAWIDGKTLGYNPAYIATLTDAQTRGLVAHEAAHIAHLHHLRRNGRDANTWNEAADHCVNYLLTESMYPRKCFSLPPGGLEGINKSAEEIYRTLKQQKQDQQNQNQQQNQTPTPQPSPAQGQGQGGQGQTPDPSQGQGQPGQQLPGDPAQSQDDATPTPTPAAPGEVRDYPAETPADQAQAEAEAKIMISQAAQQARTMGKLPAALERLVKQNLVPLVPWADYLQKFVQDAARNDYSWARPNRRHIHRGLYLPSVNSRDKLGPTIIALDTSGSIGPDTLEEFAAEVTGVLDAYETEITVIYCDRKIRHTETFTRQDLPLKLNPRGGGGTDYRPVFDWITENITEQPACMIYLTDGYCDRFPEYYTPEYPVLWTITDGGSSWFRPPFGEVIDIKQ